MIARKQKHLPAKDVELAVKHLLDLMSDSLSKGERIEIRGFGSFTVRKYKSYEGRNPRTGETVHVAPKRLPFFKVGALNSEERSTWNFLKNLLKLFDLFF